MLKNLIDSLLLNFEKSKLQLQLEYRVIFEIYLAEAFVVIH